MKWSRQTLLGLGFFVGGSVLLFAMLQQINSNNSVSQPEAVAFVEDGENQNTINLTPLTADVETEQQILAQKQQERLARVAEQERRTQAFLEEQERAEALALNKARAESELYRNNNAIEPVPESVDLNDMAAEASTQTNQAQAPEVTKPVITSRPQPTQDSANEATSPAATARQQSSPPQQSTDSNAAPTQAFDYTVRSGDGLIKLSRRYNVPLQALALANNMNTNTELRVGDTIEVPSRLQSERLLREYNAAQSSNNSSNNANASNNNSNNNNNNTDTSADDTPERNSAPSSPSEYTVKSGDGLIRLARQYNMPVSVLAQANNMATNQTLRVGQSITIPSQRQVARLQREAEERRQREEAARSAEQRLAEARRRASRGEASGRFGVQVALADDQARADEVASKLRSAGYSVSTSPTSRGVRVIVGPETGKEAALALKDKINADPNTGVNNAWVLSWR